MQLNEERHGENEVENKTKASDFRQSVRTVSHAQTVRME